VGDLQAQRADPAALTRQLRLQIGQLSLITAAPDLAT
jgi:hypothetical protein